MWFYKNTTTRVPLGTQCKDLWAYGRGYSFLIAPDRSSHGFVSTSNSELHHRVDRLKHELRTENYPGGVKERRERGGLFSYNQS